MQTEVEERHIALSAIHLDMGIDTQVHIAVNGRVIMMYRQSSARWEELREV